ncbi:type II toxin-antitoxin system Phd/YefM family antitoxin [Gaiella sp.]|jgi:prevent-host-death family protein|uniref:type II toxin-antitoxin system Phd/YefM family antitoxin n=1 Tax=Gaiella sp. TaxID=2663207 RepID=UPI002E34B796|nr:type II toxin-antitoxin system Phd/YefM family antitoxin [Gaiella sp.]HEX5583250.1 type II toxin-antitoxin system Phd/YefM family antitoxin [Gaiella sp.]
MTVVNMHEAKTHLSRLVERARQGEDVVIAKAGRPVARLVPLTEADAPRKLGGWKGRVWMADDFDELPPDVLAAFEGDSD